MMKYMGSKRAMLQTGLGEIIAARVCDGDRFVDLFTGSGAVAAFVAESFPIPVLASDLQSFATILAGAIVERSEPLKTEAIWLAWETRARSLLDSAPLYAACCAFEEESWARARSLTMNIARLIGESDRDWPFVAAYAGHYYSPKQAYEIESLRRTLPANDDETTGALAALVTAASECAAAPGHTAQPFSSSVSGHRFLFEAWKRDVFARVKNSLTSLGARFANFRGETRIGDARSIAMGLGPGDIVFVDPPYSSVQYSRFYHVLETLSRGTCGSVTGVGRYPPASERPKSAFSTKSKSRQEVRLLLETLGERGTTVIFTFPRDDASNGLSGEVIQELASEHFQVTRTEVNGRFSTLGGGPSCRGARVPAYEVILTLLPK
jgi:adenine-specific DNA methylase